MGIIARGRCCAPCHHGGVVRAMTRVAARTTVRRRSRWPPPSSPDSRSQPRRSPTARRRRTRRRSPRSRSAGSSSRSWSRPCSPSRAGWLVLARRVRQLHPEHPVPLARTAAFFGGLATIAVALLSGIARYDTTLFSVHMVQHLLLMLVAAPLLAFSAPVTQLLRASSPERPAGLADPRAPFAPGRGARAPGRRGAHVHGRRVGQPLHRAVRAGAGEPGRPRARARRVPRGGDAVLVAGDRGRSSAAPDGVSGPGPVPAACRCR